jgi:hypothetical protein
LKELDLSYNPLLTQSSYEALAEAIRNEKCELEKLNLEGNQIGNKNLLIVTQAL